MLLSLAQWLQSMSPDYGYLRVFQYLTFRAVMAALTALLIGLAAGPAVIRKLTELKIGQPIRGYGIEAHLSKSGTPTMGGVLILLSISLSTLMWVDLSNRFVWIVLLVTLAFGAIGWVDDWRKVVNKDPEGMPSREKYLWQSLIGLLAALYLVFSISEVSNLKVLELFFSWVRSGFDVNLPPKAGLLVPFFKEISYPLGVLGFVILTYLVIVGSSHAVNLTDDWMAWPSCPSSWWARPWVCLPMPQAALCIPSTCFFRTFQVLVSCWCFVLPSLVQVWPFCGSTPIPRRCSWATLARWAWAQPWAPSLSSCGKKSCWPSWAVFLWLKPCQ